MKKISFAADILPMKNLLYRLALRITMNREEAEDIVQDTLIKVWNKRDDWDNIESIEAFSLTICRNLALDRMKKAENQNASLEQENVDSADRARSPLELMEQRDRVETVRRLVNSLPEKQRLVFVARFYKHEPFVLEADGWIFGADGKLTDGVWKNSAMRLVYWKMRSNLCLNRVNMSYAFLTGKAFLPAAESQ